MDWPRHPSRSFHCENCFTLDARKGTEEGPPQDHLATDSGERNQEDGEALGRHQAYAKGLADVEGACCCPTYYLSVSESECNLQCYYCDGLASHPGGSRITPSRFMLLKPL